MSLNVFQIFLAYQIAFHFCEMERKNKQIKNAKCLYCVYTKYNWNMQNKKINKRVRLGPCDKVNTFKPTRESE